VEGVEKNVRNFRDCFDDSSSVNFHNYSKSGKDGGGRGNPGGRNLRGAWVDVEDVRVRKRER
jgi:hypothetical protein